jgi:hypothetical protein
LISKWLETDALHNNTTGHDNTATDVDSNGRTNWITGAQREVGKRFVVRADEKLAAFLELKFANCACGELPRQAGESL